MIKDPWWLFAYWEIQPSTERTARGQLLPDEVPGLQTVLRVYDVTGIAFPAQRAHTSFDIGLSGLARNWYIPVSMPDRSWIVDIGISARNGRFLILARSNQVTTPRAGPAGVTDRQWRTSDERFRKLAGAVDVRSLPSSARMAKPAAPPTSPLGGASPMPFTLVGKPAGRGFWCRVETDLILYGAAEPRSTVYMQGQPIPIRADGTFSVRLALPEGTKTITVEIISPDRRQTKILTPVITRASSVGPACAPAASLGPETSRSDVRGSVPDMLRMSRDDAERAGAGRPVAGLPSTTSSETPVGGHEGTRTP